MRSTIEYCKLSVAERLLLVEDIWDSIAAEAEKVPLTDWQRAELDNRLAMLSKDKNQGLSWEEVKKNLKIKK